MSVDSSGINLELFWEGPLIYRGHNTAQNICVKMEKAMHTITAVFATQIGTSETQQLRFEFANKKTKIRNTNTFRNIKCSLLLAKSMELCVTFKDHETSVASQQQVNLHGLTDLCGGKAYQIKITNLPSGNLIATINEKAQESFSAKPKDEERKGPFTPSEKEAHIKQALEGLTNILVMDRYPGPSPYDNLSVLDLQVKLDEVTKAMESAKQQFQRANRHHNQPDAPNALKALILKQKLTTEILYIKKAIQNKQHTTETESDQNATADARFDAMERGSLLDQPA